MKFCSFNHNGVESYGFVMDDGRIADLKLVLGEKSPRNLADLIEDIVDGKLSTDALYEEYVPEKCKINSEDVAYKAPIPRPGKIMGVAINNKLAQAVAHKPFDTPAFFFQPATALAGNGQSVVMKERYGITHPEPELAVIIGKGGKDISEENALEHVFGYSIINDITSPGLKEKDSIELVLPKEASTAYEKLLHWRENRDADHARRIYLTYHGLSKGTDNFAPMGPWLVTADEIDDPNNLPILSFDNEGPVFEDSTANLLFSVQKIISHASSHCTLETGDIIHCGTAMKPAENSKRKSFTEWDITQCHGETMSIEIPGLGVLKSPIVVKN